MQEPGKFAFIDAVRGLAILLVILVHCMLVLPPASATLRELSSGGARGVQLFYVASALTLCMSWEFRSARERSPLRNFYLRRWFRIAPMFYIAMVVYLAIFGFGPRDFLPYGIQWYHVPLTAAFLNGFHPETISSIVPGGWSIAVEMTFYLMLPFLVTRFRGVVALMAVVIAALVLDRASGFVFRRLYLPMYPPEQAYLVDNFTFLNFFAQFPVFAIGLLAYAFFRSPATMKRAAIAGGAVFLTWLLLWPRVTNATLMQVLARHVEFGFGFAALTLALGVWPIRFLVNPFTQWIGKLSYSMYLTHTGVVLLLDALGIRRWFGSGDAASLLHYAGVVAATAAVSWVCYRVIEQPGIEAGRRLIARLEAAPDASAVVRSPIP